MDMFVKIAKVPGRTVEVALAEGGATVAEALRLGEFTDTADFKVRVNGEDAGLETMVENGDTVILTKEIKGNNDEFVKIAKVPGRTVEVALSDDGASVAQALALGEFSETADFKIRVNGEDAGLETLVYNGDTVILTKEIKGN